MISVLVPVRHAEQTIARMLSSLMAQVAGNDVEVILAVCEGDRSLARATIEEPMRVVTIEAPAGIPQLRREAARRACGEYVVITEDHCCFPEGWLSGLVRVANANPGAVCGGPVGNGRLTAVGWAQYFTRYSAFLPAGADRTGTNLPGNNACYARELLASRMESLNDGFWEAEFNQELARSRTPFLLFQNLSVVQHQDRGWVEYIPLRFRHGRCYGARRFRVSGAAAKLKLMVLFPFLPAVLFLRMLRSVFQARWNRARFVAISPLILLYVFAWSAGEVFGYLMGAGNSCTETD